ncbi:hypothetical protein BC832DRAFT_595132 [Gaertneriomyces semiglobifer]|nr:hypothetical protein BC832DRAFT_595132 [Gaertneriomyces semiglobifer]
MLKTTVLLLAVPTLIAADPVWTLPDPPVFAVNHTYPISIDWGIMGGMPEKPVNLGYIPPLPPATPSAHSATIKAPTYIGPLTYVWDTGSGTRLGTNFTIFPNMTDLVSQKDGFHFCMYGGNWVESPNLEGGQGAGHWEEWLMMEKPFTISLEVPKGQVVPGAGDGVSTTKDENGAASLSAMYGLGLSALATALMSM